MPGELENSPGKVSVNVNVPTGLAGGDEDRGGGGGFSSLLHLASDTSEHIFSHPGLGYTELQPTGLTGASAGTSVTGPLVV